MPVKRRRAKTRTDPMTEAKAWSVAFKSGYDFLGDLAEFGLHDDAAVRAAMVSNTLARSQPAWKARGR